MFNRCWRLRQESIRATGRSRESCRTLCWISACTTTTWSAWTGLRSSTTRLLRELRDGLVEWTKIGALADVADFRRQGLALSLNVLHVQRGVEHRRHAGHDFLKLRRTAETGLQENGVRRHRRHVRTRIGPAQHDVDEKNVRPLREGFQGSQKLAFRPNRLNHRVGIPLQDRGPALLALVPIVFNEHDFHRSPHLSTYELPKTRRISVSPAALVARASTSPP